MLKNYLKIAFRSLTRNKAHSIINIFGLGLGIAVCILIALFVRDETTFDTFHKKADRIYRVFAREDWGEKQDFFYTVTPFPMGPALKDNFPEVERQVRFNNIGSTIVVRSEQFSETVSIGGQDLFKVFDFPAISGDPDKAMANQNGAVLTQQMATKFFGTTDPIGKSISIELRDSLEVFTIEAVVENIPGNSSIQFGVLISELNYVKLYNPAVLTSAWFNITPETYILLNEGVDHKTVEAKFPSVFKALIGEEDFVKSKYQPGLQPLTTIHLDTTYPGGIAPVNDPKYSYILGAMALLILIVACINFVTLSIGRSFKRAKEVGIRKVAGAERSQLIFQFIGESLIITMIALVAGVLLTVLCLPLFNELSGKLLTLQSNVFILLMGGSLLLIIGLIAGSYPSFVLSNFKPISILKGTLQGGKNKQLLRKVLVGVQVVLSIFLVSSTLIMQNQMEFLQHKDLGFNRDQLVVVQLNVPSTGRLSARIRKGFETVEQFKTELSPLQSIVAVCGTSHDFGNGAWVNLGFTDDQGTYRNFNMNTVDANYIPVLKMQMVQGRSFSSDNTSDARRSVIVNEAFVREYGWTNAIGMKIPGKKFPDHEIIGVVKDFNYTSLYTKVTPLAMAMDPLILLSGAENFDMGNTPIPKLMVRIRAGNVETAIAQIKGAWEKIDGSDEFTFEFVDQALAAQYRNDENLGKIVRIATLLAMIIGSLGLYALASLAMQNRTKEISIRKVMGATGRSLLVLLSSEYVYLIGISFLLSVPFTWYLMSKWLQSFEYRVDIGLSVFMLAGCLSLMIALLTIGYEAVKTTMARPADTLKYE